MGCRAAGGGPVGRGHLDPGRDRPRRGIIYAWRGAFIVMPLAADRLVVLRLWLHDQRYFKGLGARTLPADMLLRSVSSA